MDWWTDLLGRILLAVIDKQELLIDHFAGPYLYDELRITVEPLGDDIHIVISTFNDEE